MDEHHDGQSVGGMIGVPPSRRMARLAASLMLLLAVAGCSSGVSMIVPGESPQPLPPGSSLLPSGNPAYRVGPFDTLQIDVYLAPGRVALLDYGSQLRLDAAFTGAPYALAPGDTLSIEVNADTDVTSQLLIRPDGMITLPRLSRDMRAAGRTAAELGADVAGAYSGMFRSPQVTVSVVTTSTDLLSRINGQYQVGLDGKIVVPGLGAFAAMGRTPDAVARQVAATARQRFRNAVSVSGSLAQLTGRDTDPRVDPTGRTYFRGPLRVAPDGTVQIQPGPAIPVQGMTLPEVREAAIARLQPFYANRLEVGVALAESPGQSVFVAGEVRQPGRYPYQPSMTLLRLIAASGWVTDVGDLTRVLLLHPTSPTHYNVYRSNVREVMQNAAAGQDLAVGPQDIVVVPMSFIGQVDQMVDQYIRKVVPFSTVASYSYISNPVGNTVTNSSTPARVTP